ncbi:MAG: peptidoglycan editing factor PgeF [Candidatus Carbobacillus sp.]|nr:peptidoglycan editing factor PgeF [Candidatus Carbobacillus sp.]
MDQTYKHMALDEPFVLSADGWVYRWRTMEGKYPQLRAGITTREAPILKFHTPYADDETVRAHRALFERSIGVEAHTMTFAEQIHGDGVYVVRETDIGRGSNFAHEAIPQTDALVTTLIGVPLIIFVADCAPLFFYDPKKKVIALVHAGWRGTAADILRRVLQVLDGLGVMRTHLHVAIGPCIHGTVYEVDDPVIDALSKVDADSLKAASKKTRPGHYMLDLPTFHRLLLEKEGIPKGHVESSHYCTYTHARHFYSYRREGSLAGRMAAYMVQLS